MSLRPALVDVLGIGIRFFAAWTLAYHLGLVLAISAAGTGALFVLVATPLVASGYRRSRPLHALRTEWRFVVALGSVSLAVGVATLFLSRPDPDDFSFFHRALVQLDHLSEPFLTGDTIHGDVGLPGLSILHSMTSYEPLVALSAVLLQVDPLWSYQNGFGALAVSLFPIVLVAVLLELRVRRWPALAGVIGSIAFLVLDGNLHRSFGTFTIVRSWQGKCILIMLLLPLTLLFGRRFLARPSRRRFFDVTLVSICGVGLSSSGVLLVPGMVAVTALAYLLAYGPSGGRLYRSMLLCLAPFYGLGIGLLSFVGLLRMPRDTSAWSEGWPSGWWENLGLVLGDEMTMARNVLILVGLPLVAWGRPLWRWIPCLTVAWLVLFANPLLGPVWLELLHPAGYWRTAYLLPLPLCAALSVSLLVDCMGRIGSGRALMKVPWKPAFLVGAVAILATVAAFETSALSGSIAKSPAAYKLSPKIMAFARSIDEHLPGRHVLAPRYMTALTFFERDITLEAARRKGTLHKYRNAGREGEGRRRQLAQEVVERGRGTSRHVSAFQEAIENGVDAIVVPDAHVDLVSRLLRDDERGWTMHEGDGGFNLVVQSPSASHKGLRAERDER